MVSRSNINTEVIIDACKTRSMPSEASLKGSLNYFTFAQHVVTSFISSVLLNYYNKVFFLSFEILNIIKN
jgi:hypothetical protein